MLGVMSNGDVFGALKSFGVEAKRATERAKQSFYQRVRE